MNSQSNRRRDVAMFLVALLTLLFIAGDHPLVEHWGDIAMSSNEEWGSKDQPYDESRPLPQPPETLATLGETEP